MNLCSMCVGMTVLSCVLVCIVFLLSSLVCFSLLAGATYPRQVGRA